MKKSLRRSTKSSLQEPAKKSAQLSTKNSLPGSAKKSAQESKQISSGRTGKNPLQTKPSLSFDAAAATKIIAGRDKTMARVIKAVGPCRLEEYLEEMNDCFAGLSKAIVFQQLTAKAAGTIFDRVKKLCADEPFSAERILELSDETMRAQGLSRAKTAAIKDLAERTVKGLIPDLAELQDMEDEEIVKIISSVRGIGEWTVQMLLIFNLGRQDVMPHTDYGLRKAFAAAFDLDDLPTPRQLLAHSENWRPYRTVASWYLWRLLDLDDWT